MEILIPDIPAIEKLVRTAVIYGFRLVAFRLAGKRQLGQMSPFDLIVLLVISNAVQNSLIGNDNSLGGGLIAATALLVMNGVVAWGSARFRGIERLVENTPTVLVQHGRVLADNLRRECMTLLEDGHVSVIRRRRA
jgi:uncharacterized membrane protein YcaP (DUF421 family)